MKQISQRILNEFDFAVTEGLASVYLDDPTSETMAEPVNGPLSSLLNELTETTPDHQATAHAEATASATAATSYVSLTPGSADIETLLNTTNDGTLPHKDAQHIKNIYEKYPKSITDTARRVLVALNSSHPLETAHIGLLETLSAKVRDKKASLPPNVLDGVTSIAILARLSKLPNLIHARHIIETVKLGLSEENIKNLVVIYRNNPQLIGDSFAAVLRSINGRISREPICRALVETISIKLKEAPQQQTPSQSASLNGITDVEMLAILSSVPGLIRAEHITHSFSRSQFPELDAVHIRKIYMNCPALVAGSVSVVLKKINNHMHTAYDCRLLVDMITELTLVGKSTLKSTDLEHICMATLASLCKVPHLVQPRHVLNAFGKTPDELQMGMDITALRTIYQECPRLISLTLHHILLILNRLPKE